MKFAIFAILLNVVLLLRETCVPSRSPISPGHSYPRLAGEKARRFNFALLSENIEHVVLGTRRADAGFSAVTAVSLPSAFLAPVRTRMLKSYLWVRILTCSDQVGECNKPEATVIGQPVLHVLLMFARL